MKFIKKILVFSVLAIAILIVAIGLRFWTIDPRFSGTFQSNAKDSIEYIASIENLPKAKLDKIQQAFGHRYYAIDGHILKGIQEGYTVVEHSNGSSTTIERNEAEFFVLMRRSGNSAAILLIPKAFWQSEEFRIMKIEFTEDGFWLLSQPGSLFSNYKEKFTKISANKAPS